MLKQSILTALALTAAAVPAPVDNVEGIKVPIHHNHYEPRSDGTFDEPRFRAMLQRTLDKYKSGVVLTEDTFSQLRAPVENEKRATGKVPLTDQVEAGKTDELYYGNAKVGGQTFTVDFDTGSADFFVQGPNCKGCNGKGAKYDQGGTDRHKTTSVTYGSGQVSGEDYYDTVTVGGLSAPHTNVISLKNAQGFSGSASNSLMGMGFSSIAESKSPTFVENLISQKKLSKNEFAFFLGRAKSGTQGKSEMIIGGADASHYTGPLSKHKVSDKGYWQIPIDGGFSGKGSPQGAGQAAIDTGTTIILGPTDAVTQFMTTQFGATPVPGAGGTGVTLFAYNCGSKNTLGLAFGGKKYLLNPLDISLGKLGGVPILGGGMCVASVGAADLNPGEQLYVVGDSFLKNYYAIFSYEDGASVSFAKSKA